MKTEFFIVLQYDGFVLNGNNFLNSFLDFDYIMPPWPHFDCHKVGNGGFTQIKKTYERAPTDASGKTFAYQKIL